MDGFCETWSSYKNSIRHVWPRCDLNWENVSYCLQSLFLIAQEEDIVL